MVEAPWGYKRGGKGSRLVVRRSKAWCAHPTLLLVGQPQPYDRMGLQVLYGVLGANVQAV